MCFIFASSGSCGYISLIRPGYHTDKPVTNAIDKACLDGTCMYKVMWRQQAEISHSPCRFSWYLLYCKFTSAGARYQLSYNIYTPLKRPWRHALSLSNSISDMLVSMIAWPNVVYPPLSLCNIATLILSSIILQIFSRLKVYICTR